MNGAFVNFLLWAAAGLTALVSTLIGFIVHLHIKSDEQHRALSSREFDIQKDLTDQEIGRLRDAMHEVRNGLSEIKSIVGMRQNERGKK